MTVHPFIEAEKRAGHSVKRACELLMVSRAAYYARRTGTPGARAVRDAELTKQIAAVHTRSRGTYGVRAAHTAHGGSAQLARRAAMYQGAFQAHWPDIGPDAELGWSALVGAGELPVQDNGPLMWLPETIVEPVLFLRTSGPATVALSIVT